MRLFKLVLASVLASVSFLPFSIAANSSRAAQSFDLESYLSNLDRDPFGVMSPHRPLFRRATTREGVPLGYGTSHNISQFQERRILNVKRQLREKFLGDNLKPFSNPTYGDLARDLVDDRDAQGQILEFKVHIEDLDLWKSFYLPEEIAPWSGDYWAASKGFAASRYLDPTFNAIHNWSRAREYSLRQNPASRIVDQRLAGELGDEAIDQLAPTEKYELLIGDAAYGLTRYNWARGDGLQGPEGNIEDWMGICDGWAAASIVLPRPHNKIVLQALQHDFSIIFYPADLMALVSYLWAERSPHVKFVGGRCDLKEPRRDPESGRLLDDECFNNNPATWHLALLNQLNQARRSMVVDVFFDYEVWNQPILGYRLKYFNPKTGVATDSLSEARVAYSEMGKDNARKDIFKKFRNTSTFTHLVGVQMELTYVGEIDSSRLSPFTPAHDYHETITLIYDLEIKYDLDAQGQPVGPGEVVGGEWYAGKHPDFMWVPYPNAMASGYYESALAGNWALDQNRIPQEWSKIAIYNSRNGTPVNKILKALIERSRQNP